MLVKLNKKVNQHVTVEENLAKDMTYFQNKIRLFPPDRLSRLTIPSTSHILHQNSTTLCAKVYQSLKNKTNFVYLQSNTRIAVMQYMVYTITKLKKKQQTNP